MLNVRQARRNRANGRLVGETAPRSDEGNHQQPAADLEAAIRDVAMGNAIFGQVERDTQKRSRLARAHAGAHSRTGRSVQGNDHLLIVGVELVECVVGFSEFALRTGDHCGDVATFLLDALPELRRGGLDIDRNWGEVIPYDAVNVVRDIDFSWQVVGPCSRPRQRYWWPHRPILFMSVRARIVLPQ
jgi:hypothetical protein